MTRRILSRSALAGGCAAALATSCLVAPPAHALFGLGDVVYDPANYAQNVLTAVRSLEQINNQIRQIQNQATSLLNEAKNLESLPVSTLADLKAQVEQTQALLAQARRVAFNVQAVQQAFSDRYKGTALTANQTQMVAHAEARWQDSVAAFEDALQVQAGVVGNIEPARTAMDTLVRASQSASGALQAAQAGNQLLALQARQLADVTAALAAQGRAQALAAARDAASEAEGRARFQRFRGN